MFRVFLIVAIFFGTIVAPNAAEESLGTKIKKLLEATPTPTPTRKQRKRVAKKSTPTPSPSASPKRKKTSPAPSPSPTPATKSRSEEHTSELQSHSDLVCRL